MGEVIELGEWKYGKRCADCGVYADGCTCGVDADEWKEQEHDEGEF